MINGRLKKGGKVFTNIISLDKYFYCQYQEYWIIIQLKQNWAFWSYFVSNLRQAFKVTFVQIKVATRTSQHVNKHDGC